MLALIPAGVASARGSAKHVLARDGISTFWRGNHDEDDLEMDSFHSKIHVQ